MDVKNKNKLCVLTPFQVEKVIDIKLQNVLYDLNEISQKESGERCDLFRTNVNELQEVNVDADTALINYLGDINLDLLQDYYFPSIKSSTYFHFEKLFVKHFSNIFKSINCQYEFKKTSKDFIMTLTIPNMITRINEDGERTFFVYNEKIQQVVKIIKMRPN